MIETRVSGEGSPVKQERARNQRPGFFTPGTAARDR